MITLTMDTTMADNREDDASELETAAFEHRLGAAARWFIGLRSPLAS